MLDDVDQGCFWCVSILNIFLGSFRAGLGLRWGLILGAKGSYCKGEMAGRPKTQFDIYIYIYIYISATVPAGHQWSVSSCCEVCWSGLFTLGDPGVNWQYFRSSPRLRFSSFFGTSFPTLQNHPWSPISANLVPKWSQKVTPRGSREASKIDLVSKTAKLKSVQYLQHFSHVGHSKKTSISEPKIIKKR